MKNNSKNFYPKRDNGYNLTAQTPFMRDGTDENIKTEPTIINKPGAGQRFSCSHRSNKQGRKKSDHKPGTRTRRPSRGISYC